MKFGDLEFQVISDGVFRLDGGAMCGVVPRPLWERKFPPDDRNRIELAMNCILIRASGTNILVDTGAGSKLEGSVREIFGIENSLLVERLHGYGLRPEDIHIVVNTHLHFDHCGGNTRMDGEKAVPVFPNARYIIHKGEREHAKNPNVRDRLTYLPENYDPVEAAGQMELREGDSTVVPGVELVEVPGHTANMWCVKLTGQMSAGGAQTAFFFVDLVPTAVHLQLSWIMSYDLYPMTTLENKKRLLPLAAREGWLALFCHDARVPAAYIRERDKRWEAEPAKVD